MHHDGYVCVGNAAYDKTDWLSAPSHLTTHTRMAGEGKGTWDDLATWSMRLLKEVVLHSKTVEGC